MNEARRDFLKYAGITTLTLTSSTLVPTLGCASKVRKPSYVNPDIISLPPTMTDTVVLSPGFSYKILISWKDNLNQKDQFGINNDFIAFIPQKKSTTEALLWVNHESPQPYLIHGEKDLSKKTKDQIVLEQQSVGGSVLHIEKKSEQWNFVQNSKLNRRITAETKIPFAWNENIYNSNFAIGTLGNCNGGITPWGHILTCEENYDDYYGDVKFKKNERYLDKKAAHGWNMHFDYPPEHYGWVNEVNPLNGESKKLVALGRFAHEGARVVTAPNGQLVVYMGDDCENEHVYKFISDKKDSLESGILYAANFDAGTWEPLHIENPKLKNKFLNQTDLLIQTRKAAKLAGATQADRPEAIDIIPQTGTILVACTNNVKKLDFHGYIFAIDEENKDPTSLRFSSKVWLECGTDSGISCPDNFVVDPNGNLWVTGDMSERHMGSFPYKQFGNNGLFYIPTSGQDKGVVYQIASAPTDAEFTGPCFSADFKTLFLSVQHPGARSSDEKGFTSHWPNTSGKPLSSVITISGPLLDKLLHIKS